jgi:hypothetical protein
MVQKLLDTRCVLLFVRGDFCVTLYMKVFYFPEGRFVHFWKSISSSSTGSGKCVNCLSYCWLLAGSFAKGPGEGGGGGPLASSTSLVGVLGEW